MIRLFSAEVCPFAQRTRAVLNHLDIEFELVEIDLNDKPDEFLEISPTGKVPLLEIDDLVLYESQLINDYLTDRYQWFDAYPDQPEDEYRQKLVMKQWDAVILEPFYEGLSDPEILYEAEDDIRNELSVMDKVFRDTVDSGENMISFHLATFWARMKWLSDYSEFPGWIEEYQNLKQGLDRALEHPAIEHTLPEKEPTVKSYEENYIGERVS